MADKTLIAHSDGSNWYYRYTYELTTSNTDKVTFTIKKYEVKLTSAPTDGSWKATSGLYFNFYYYSNRDNRTRIDITYASHTLLPSYVTAWSGSKSYTVKKQYSISDIFFGFGGGSIEIPALPKFNMLYNAAGGTNPPSRGTKYYGETYTVASATPTRTGYTFVNWLSSSDAKYYLPKSLYAPNIATTFTAQWNVNKYTISYNANGGSGSVASQKKEYDKSGLTFQTGDTLSYIETIGGIIRERKLVEGEEWNTNPDASGTSYAAGAVVPNITNNLKLYANWELVYFYPKLTNLQDYRTATSNPNDIARSDTGEYIYITFDFIGYSDDGGVNYKIPKCNITIDDDVYTNPTDFQLSFDSNTNTGTLNFKPNVAYSKDAPHNIVIELYCADYPTCGIRKYDYITASIYPIDLYTNDQIFSEITNPPLGANPSALKWYELVEGEYKLTTDTTVTSGKTYYEKQPDEVYMGIMHPYKRGTTLLLPDTDIDGNIEVYSKWEQSIAPPSSNQVAGIRYRDITGYMLGQVRTVHYKDTSRIGTIISANRLINGEDKGNYLLIYVDDEGNRGYTISDKAAFRDALDLEVTTPDITITATTGTYVAHNIKKAGHVIQLQISVKNSTACSEGTSIFIGNLSTCRPVAVVYGSSSISGGGTSTRIFTSSLAANGDINIRIAKGSTAADTAYSVSFTYITND